MRKIYEILKNEYINMFGIKRLMIFRIILCYYRCIEYRAIVLIRIYLQRNKGFIKRLIRKKLALKYNIEIGINPKIGKNFRMPHIQNIIIGNEVIIGDNCVLYQGVTLGQKHNGINGYGEDPILRDNVTVFAGAKIFGKIEVGNNAIIGANAVVFKDVPQNTCAVGVPAKIIERKK